MTRTLKGISTKKEEEKEEGERTCSTEMFHNYCKKTLFKGNIENGVRLRNITKCRRLII